MKYFSQWDEPVGRSACGPACVQMVLGEAKIYPSLLELVTLSDAGRNGTTAADLVNLFLHYGVEARITVKPQLPDEPGIILFNYGALSREDVQDVNYRGLHWMLFLGIDGDYAVVNDPDYAGARRDEGDHKRYHLSEVRAGYANQAIVWTVKESKPIVSTEYIVHGDGGVNVRPDPSTAKPRIGIVKSGDHVQVLDVVNGWARVALTAGQAVMVGDTSLQVVGFMYAGLLQAVDTPTPPAPPTPTGTHSLGVNVIGQAQIAKELSGVGCKAFVIVDNPDACVAIKTAHPDAIVVNRRWSNDQLTGDQQYAKFGSIGYGVINECFNEQDGSHSYGTVSEITTRINYELDWYRHVKAAGHVAALGCYSTGTPDFTNPAICEQVKRYATLYNNDGNVYFSMHNYSPNMAHIHDDSALIWYERRFEFLFTKCGFNPALRKVIMTETGVDEQGVGGFPAHNATAQQYSAWCDRYQKIVSGTQVVASMIFAFTRGADKKWAGYEVGQWPGELAKAATWA